MNCTITLTLVLLRESICQRRVCSCFYFKIKINTMWFHLYWPLRYMHDLYDPVHHEPYSHPHFSVQIKSMLWRLRCEENHTETLCDDFDECYHIFGAAYHSVWFSDWLPRKHSWRYCWTTYLGKGPCDGLGATGPAVSCKLYPAPSTDQVCSDVYVQVWWMPTKILNS